MSAEEPRATLKVKGQNWPLNLSGSTTTSGQNPFSAVQDRTTSLGKNGPHISEVVKLKTVRVVPHRTNKLIAFPEGFLYHTQAIRNFPSVIHSVFVERLPPAGWHWVCKGEQALEEIAELGVRQISNSVVSMPSYR